MATARTPGSALVVIGASAGGVEALVRLVREIPDDLDAALLVVVHVPPDARSRLPQILSRNGPLPARHATDGEPILPGAILVAPPDRHLIVDNGRVRTLRGPTENLHRPAVDPLFRSAAVASRQPLVAIVLSGALDDGVAGAQAVRDVGGLIVIQDPSDALIPSMPRSVLDVVRVDQQLPADEIGRRLGELAADAVRRGRRDSARLKLIRSEVAMAELDAGALGHDDHPGDPSAFACPDCGGVLWEIDDEGRIRFRCRTGHAYTSRALMAAQDETLEEALWSALRALEEQSSLARRLADRSKAFGAEWTERRLQRRADEAVDRAAVLRRFLMTEPSPSEPAEVTPDEAPDLLEERVDARAADRGA